MEINKNPIPSLFFILYFFLEKRASIKMTRIQKKGSSKNDKIFEAVKNISFVINNCVKLFIFIKFNFNLRTDFKNVFLY